MYNLLQCVHIICFQKFSTTCGMSLRWTVNLYNEKRDFTLTQISKPAKHPPEQNLPYA